MNSCIFLFLAGGLLLGSAAAAPVQTPHVEAELIAERTGLEAGGGPQWVALRLAPEKGWHVYWRNPGDSGIPTSIAWTLPQGISAGEIHWPYPHRESLGELTNYGYGDETLHLIPLTVAANAPPGPARLLAQAKWLVCADICIPGEAELELTLPVGTATAEPDPRWAGAFERARAQLPRTLPALGARFAIEGEDLVLAIDGLGEELAAAREIEFFPFDGTLVTHSAPQRIQRGKGELRLGQTLSPYFTAAPERVDGVLVLHPAKGPAAALSVGAVPGPVAPLEAGAAAAAPEPDHGLAGILLFALLGGLILNLMPCVFPVLSLKALGVLHARAESRRDQRLHALAYTAGVLASFGAVAGALIALRAGGAAIGWGFQLQSPVFVTLLVYLLFVLGLSLSGWVNVGTRWMGAGQALTRRPGHAGSFCTGVLAVVVASPCTAPFMGTAMGYALTQPAGVALAVFLTLGFGLALPFLLLGLVPALAAWLPRPGAWMEGFKQLLAFPLYLTAVWLLWVLGGLTDRNGMALALVGLVLLGFALWLTRSPRWPARALALASVLGAAALLVHPLLRPPAVANPEATARHAAESWEPYSDARFEELRAKGRTVFVDFTADWCLTCKINERVALRSKPVLAAFAEHRVALLVGDWTAQDPAIAAVLRRYGRDGVPLYLVSRRGGKPEVLPQLLTPGLVTQALAKAP